KDLREQIEAQSFALGRSESAVAVMHNVRNALSPISTVISHGIGRTPPVDQALLTRAAEELGRADLPEARRAKLGAFVAAGVSAMAAARAEQVEQLGIGRDALVHVLDIIGQQQAAAHERPQLSECDMTDVIAQNATIARYSGKTQIAFSYPAEPCPVLANRVILSQVVGNLFANAAEAIAAAGRASGRITVSFAQVNEAIEVRISDDGEGFESHVGATLFQRGYSTRAHKSGGLGLHWCANSMTAMEGALRLESEGRGAGASAILTLKRAQVAALDQAA
ncbi:ATP-binding protein, partial [Sphingomonas sp.]|uniref:ATP-binding protein n=1 Tax=Sphingomonas sp. TaxID=28214 RepID=UPI0035C7A761